MKQNNFKPPPGNLADSDILKICTLVDGGTLTQQQITDIAGREWNQVREELYFLVTKGHLTRFCGVGSSPAIYCLPQFRQQYA